MSDTIPGGYYLGADGEPHDAFGNKVAKQSDKALEQAKEGPGELTAEQEEALRQQAAQAQAQSTAPVLVAAPVAKAKRAKKAK